MNDRFDPAGHVLDDPAFRMAEELQHPLANIEAEAAALGALMIENKLIADARMRLRDEDFFEPLHGRIYAAILKLHDRGTVATPVTLRPFFEVDPGMQDLGGAGYLAQLTGSGAALIGANSFFEQIAELAGYRRARDTLIAGVEDIEADPNRPLVEVLTKVETDLWAAAATASPVRSQTGAGMINRVLERNARVVENATPEGASCRFVNDMDKIIGLAEPGTYNIIAGRPGQMKSTLAESMCLGYAANGVPSEYFHAEMTEEQMAMRIASDLCHGLGMAVPHKRLKQGNLTSTELQALDRAMAIAGTMPFNFTAVKRCDVRQIDSMVARAKVKWARKGKTLGVCFVDYLQLLTATLNGRVITDKTARVSAVSGALLDVAQKHGVALFALAQLGRAVEDRKDHRPQLNDLKDSGDIEQDADSVTCVFREETYLLKEQPRKGEPNYDKLRSQWETDFDAVRGKIELIGLKNRHGEPLTRVARAYGANYAIRSSDFNEYADEALLFDLGGEER